MNERKYISEFGLVSVAGYRFLLQQDQLHQIEKTGIKPHIYFIGRRPRIMLDVKTVKFTDHVVTGSYLVQRGLDIERHNFVTRNELGTSEATIECAYPHTEYKIRDENKEVIANGKTALLMAETNPEFLPLLNLEVLYIGQAYGSEGDRTADVRLASHSTLQQIYSEAIRRSPDHEIWLILCTFEMQLLTSIDGRSKNIKSTMDEDSAHIHNVIENPITEQQQINFTEAALIRYFQPEYNVVFKDSFPSPAHTTYSQCYDLDLNMVMVEINTDVLSLELFSPTVEAKDYHLAKFELHNSNERKAMFDLL